MSMHLFTILTNVQRCFENGSFVNEFNKHTTCANISWSSRAVTALLTPIQDRMLKANTLYRKFISISVEFIKSTQQINQDTNITSSKYTAKSNYV